MNHSDTQKIQTLGQLKATDYRVRSIKTEIRENLIRKLKARQPVFEGIYGYEDTVGPEVERALLSRHNILFLGLRGQAKTRMARLMLNLLDEYIPAIEGCELNDDPLLPISHKAKDIIAEKGDDTPLRWIHRSERYTEKLATPDVSVADLIGDVDPIKAAALKLPYSDERVIHYGLVPHAHRSIFVINELPDLQARIQVALFNILQEGDIQIRGFKFRLPLDIQFVFTANPEDYTNRGSIVTPLKDRIESQIITHYPEDRTTGRKITQQEARIDETIRKAVEMNEVAKDLIEQLAFEARESEYVDEKSGVSARMTITALESLYSAAEQRLLRNDESHTHVRISDFWGTIPAITGKIELVYEGEQEGAGIVAQNLIAQSLRAMFQELFPDPEKSKKLDEDNPYKPTLDWFSDGNTVDILNDLSEKDYHSTLDSVPGLKRVANKEQPKATEAETYFLMEFLLHGLAEFSAISKKNLKRGVNFGDLFSSMFNMDGFDPDDEDGFEDLQ